MTAAELRAEEAEAKLATAELFNVSKSEEAASATAKAESEMRRAEAAERRAELAERRAEATARPQPWEMA